MPNDLLDQRDYLVGELSKLTKVSVTKDGNNYSIFIGNGQPMVVGSTVSKLQAVTSPTDSSEVAVGLVTSTGTIRLADNSLPGGKLGGLLEFRATTLTNAQNELGRIALGLAMSFNDQHKLGMDQTGAMGGNFFSMAPPVVNMNTLNTGDGMIAASVTDASLLKASDYKLVYDGTNYTVTRMRDNVQVSSIPGPGFPVDGITVEGVNIALASGTMAAGDNFIVKPTVNAASSISVLVTDTLNIAAAAPIAAETPTSNAGSGAINSATVDKHFLPSMATPPIDLYYDAATKTLNDSTASPQTGFAFPVKVTVNGTSTIYPAGTPVPYTAGATITFGAALPGPPPDVGGMSVKIGGMPAQGDKFTVSANSSLSGDNRNMVLLAGLQTANTLMDGTTTYQGALAQLVSSVGNKTHELEVGKNAQGNLVTQLRQAQDADSGVNLDEEGANMLRYQQAYMAAGKVMQAVKEMFDLLMSLGRV
jgi:flagellar hook-associated protein 1 FlgK